MVETQVSTREIERNSENWNKLYAAPNAIANGTNGLWVGRVEV